MRNVCFVAPFPMDTTLAFAAAIRGLTGVRLLGVFQQPPGGPGAGMFDDMVQVADAMDSGNILRGVETLSRRWGPIHRVVGVLENLQVQLAEVRGALGLPGPDVGTALRFRDKGVMKDALRAAGIPCARHRRLRSVQDARDFAREVGFPLVLKPPAGAGARSTWRVKDAGELERAVAALQPGPGREVLAEEFLRGREYSFETITLDGVPRFHSISRYLPTPLEVLENPWIQWACVLPRDISGPEYDDARELGFATIKALGLRTAVTHMEWFRRDDGSLAVGEIALRPPGAQITEMTGLAHNMDFKRAWARLMVDDAFDGPWSRDYAVGVAFFRGVGQGRVRAVLGLDEAQAKIGQHVLQASLPQIGAPRRDTYEGDGYAIVRHPDTEVVMHCIKTLIETVRTEYA
jgi:hypothetical protein